MSRRATTLIVLSLLLWTTFGAPAAIAQANDYNKFGVSLGVFFTDRDTETRVDSSTGTPGSNIDMESVLGLDSSDSVFRIDSYFRFAKNHQINLSVFDLSRTASVQLQQDVTWGDTTFPIDTVVDSDFDLRIYKIDYTWRFMQRDKGYLGATGGLYVADIDMNIESPSTSQFERDGITAPLPVIGLRGQYDFSDKWSFYVDAEIFALEYGDFDGQLYDVYAGLDYGFSERVAVGIGINSVSMDLSVSKPDLVGDLNWTYTGALLFLKFEF